MRICTRVRVVESHHDAHGLVVDRVEVLDMSIVGDDHDFRPDGSDIMHLEAAVLIERPGE